MVVGRFGSSQGASTQTNIEIAASAKSLEPDIAQRITALKNRRSPQPNLSGFTFDPEPLRLTTPEGQQGDE
jgi:hypothetical protein